MDPDQAQDIIRCQYCEEAPAQFHCVPCGDELCPRCKTFHLKSKVPSGHNVIPISERLEPTNMIRMCETHPSKPYDACCEECQVPVCILCIQEIHKAHRIGKMQDMYEKQKAETVKELSELKTQKRADAIQRIKDVENGELRIKTSHENIREEMKRQAKALTDHITAILSKGLGESEADERSKLEELSQHKVELEDYQRKVEHVIDKLENLTESSPLADLILYRKQNPDVVKQLKCPDTVVTTDPKFTVGKFNKLQNEKQFGQMTKTKLSRMKADKMTPATRKILQPVKLLHEIPGKKELRHVTCVGDERMYISGSGCGIILIDRSRSHLDTITTDGEPSHLAVMKDGSLIYFVRDDCAIYRIFPNKKKRKVVHTAGKLLGLCCTRSGDIVCMYIRTEEVSYNYMVMRHVIVVRYRGSGYDMIHKFEIDHELHELEIGPEPHERELQREMPIRPICENVNGDICICHNSFNKNGVVVYCETGNIRFNYDGRGGRWEAFPWLSHGFEPCALATNSVGHIIVSDNTYQVVHLISQDGEFIAYILTKDDGISRLRDIAVDHSDNLWVIDRNNVIGYQQRDRVKRYQHRDLVKVYQYLS